MAVPGQREIDFQNNGILGALCAMRMASIDYEVNVWIRSIKLHEISI